MKVHKIIALVTVLLLVSLITSCESHKPIKRVEESPQVEETESGLLQVKNQKKLTIGVSLIDFDNVFIADLKNAMETKAKELGVRLIISDGKNSSEKQVSHVENFIAQMVDIIIINPVTMSGCKPAVDSAVRAGIPILTVNTLVENQDKCVAFVGSDAIQSGKIQMEYAAGVMRGRGNIVVLRGPVGHDAEIGRRKGMQEVIDKYPDLKVIFEQSANWSRDEGMAIMENWLQLNEEIDAVISQNDEMAIGAIKAIEKAGKAGQILVFGIDAIPEALMAIKEGKMEATVFQDAKAQGVMAVQAAVKVAKGEMIESNIYIPYVLVTRNDIYKYIK